MTGKEEIRGTDKPDPENTPITEIMEVNFAQVHPETPVADIYRSFTQKGCFDIIVCDEECRFLGIITRMDLLSAITPGMGIRSRRKLGCLECLHKSAALHASELMTRSHVTVPDTATIAETLQAMEKNRHPDVIVVDTDGIALGLVEMCDIIAFLVREGEI
ncbi:CBS domain-containing protein [Methanogenium sp. S4BF]|uniref:CBS domain-containing protein n=1 Tax=Methanogenium sp. S4BF TaxID=1789226 RepID=UPI002417E4EA|nr:CBS domain-containing protein [Methanogenium sp. S4BF]WFN33665.1 CBS domain-containing protein [Methanogenium sp. S4BF]